MDLNQAATIVSACAAAISGVFWFASTLINIPMGVTYLSGAPKDVTAKMGRQAIFNGIAAFAAGVAGFAQALPVVRIWLGL